MEKITNRIIDLITNIGFVENELKENIFLSFKYGDDCLEIYLVENEFLLIKDDITHYRYLSDYQLIMNLLNIEYKKELRILKITKIIY